MPHAEGGGVSRIPLVIELCAGTANFTYGLVGGVNARFPISRMGNKLGYRSALYGALGLRHGQGADAVVLVEADTMLCAAHRLLVTSEGCRAVAAVIRGWIGEDARQLWERLRATPVPEGEAEAVGAWMVSNAWSYQSKGPEHGFHDPHLLHGDHGEGPTSERLEQRMIAASALAWPPVQIIEGDVAGVSPEAVAGWLYVQTRTGSAGNGGFVPEQRFGDSRRGPDVPNGTSGGPDRKETGDRCDGLTSLPWPPTIISNADVADVRPGVLPEGTVCYIDPPYQNTTGYAHTLPREQVLAVARRWSEAGAIVCVSEAVPLPLDGWYHLEITGARVGQKRTFSKQQREWLTINRPPVVRPMEQGVLW